MSVLDSACLVLNRNWLVTTFLPVRTAIVTCMRDQATVLDPETYILHSFEEWAEQTPETLKNHQWIQTASNQIASPQVIVLKKYGERPPRTLNFNRPNVYKRDERMCQYCGDQIAFDDMTLDHVIPRSRGGQLDWSNAVAACKECNSQKADKTPKEAGMVLRKQPTKPDWTPKVRLPNNSAILPAWQPFLVREGVM